MFITLFICKLYKGMRFKSYNLVGRFWGLVLAVLLISGCSSTVEVALDGTSDMNNGGNAAVVKVYQLKSNQNFKGALASSFWRDDEAALGGALVKTPKRTTVFPSEEDTFEMKLADKTKFIAVAGNLRKPEQDRWKAIEAVESMGDRVTVTVKKNELQVAFDSPGLKKVVQ